MLRTIKVYFIIQKAFLFDHTSSLVQLIETYSIYFFFELRVGLPLHGQRYPFGALNCFWPLVIDHFCFKSLCESHQILQLVTFRHILREVIYSCVAILNCREKVRIKGVLQVVNGHKIMCFLLKSFDLKRRLLLESFEEICVPIVQ